MYLPLMLNLTGKKVVIIGGGAVGLKKACKIDAYGGKLTVVSLSFIGGFEQLKGVETIQAPYESGQIRDAWLVIAATSNRVLNEQIYHDCQLAKTLCNVVDNGALSDVIFPASFSQGELTISVSTGGNSPLLAKEILSTVSALYDEKFEKRMRLMGEIRRHVIETEKNPVKKQHQLEGMLQLSISDLEIYLEAVRAVGGQHL